MEPSPIDAHHDPRVWDEQVWLLESLDVFVPVCRVRTMYVRARREEIL